MSVRQTPAGQPVNRDVRCAIYTRKSTEEGLEKEFNSLDAQREACAAYVASQRHEGWTLIPDVYDDGGYSGSSIERPAFRRLMADVAARKIDTIVVYKVDRLTRSLSDFAKIVDILEAAGSSFVSITQSFNTTTSMGRLTLNILLSFAQFERELISERVRDKISASKKKGMWMGGPVPLGYDIVNRKLVVNAKESQVVRHIMSSYLRLGTVPKLVQFLRSEGLVSKIRHRRCGQMVGGTPYQRGALYMILSNQIYRGKVSHKNEIYEGEHEAVVSDDIWDSVQAQLKTNSASRISKVNACEPSPLTGLVFDDFGRRMKPCHSKKGSVRYRYYASIEDALARDEHQGQTIRRIAAGDLETLVAERLMQLLANPAKLSGQLESPNGSWDLKGFWDTLAYFQSDLADMTNRQVGEVGQQIDLQIIVGKDTAAASFDTSRLAQLTGLKIIRGAEKRICLFTPVTIERRNHRTSLPVEMGGDGRAVSRDGSLIALLMKAHSARNQLLNGTGHKSLSYSDRHITRMARLAFLAPDITASILDGTQPRSLTARRLLRAAEIPLAWADQRHTFGFTKSVP